MFILITQLLKDFLKWSNRQQPNVPANVMDDWKFSDHWSGNLALWWKRIVYFNTSFPQFDLIKNCINHYNFKVKVINFHRMLRCIIHQSKNYVQYFLVGWNFFCRQRICKEETWLLIINFWSSNDFFLLPFYPI